MSDGNVVEGTTAIESAPASDSQGAGSAVGTLEHQNGNAAPQAQGAAVEDNFTSVDPKTLPPELQAVHKSLQGDYTKKTMAIAEERKRFAEAEKKAAIYDQLNGDARFKEYWQGLNRTEKADFKAQKAEEEQRLGQKITDDEFMKSFNSKDDFLSLIERVVEEKRAGDRKEIEQLRNENTLNKAAEIIDAIRTEKGKDGNPIRPDFDDLDQDNLITGFLQVNPAENPSQYPTRVMEAYNWAKSVSTKYYEKGKADALKVIQTKALNSSQPPTQNVKNAYTGTDPKKLDAFEAVALARKGIRVPQ